MGGIINLITDRSKQFTGYNGNVSAGAAVMGMPAYFGNASTTVQTGKLAASVGKTSLDSVEDVCAALTQRLEHFKKLGCRASDHGLDYIPFRPCPTEKANKAFKAPWRGGA